jgi:hypothetical protein
LKAIASVLEPKFVQKYIIWQRLQSQINPFWSPFLAKGEFFFLDPLTPVWKRGARGDFSAQTLPKDY